MHLHHTLLLPLTLTPLASASCYTKTKVQWADGGSKSVSEAVGFACAAFADPIPEGTGSEFCVDVDGSNMINFHVENNSTRTITIDKHVCQDGMNYVIKTCDGGGSFLSSDKTYFVAADIVAGPCPDAKPPKVLPHP